MSENKIKELVFCGVWADPETVRQAAKAAMVIIARGKFASSWLVDIGVEAGNTWEFAQGVQGKDFEIIHGQLMALIPETVDIRVLYVTPLQPFAIDLVGRQLAEQAEYIIEIPGADTLTALLTLDGTIANGSVQSLDGLKILRDQYPAFSPSMPVVLHLAGIIPANSMLLSSLLQVYPAGTPVYLLESVKPGKWQSSHVEKIGELDSSTLALYIPALSVDASLESFMQVIARLRAPDGCPWDRKQTHTSLRTYLLEETYEALEALDNQDMTGLKEELGDLLLQIALHSQIAAETDTFTITQVIQSISRKIVSRHPHVFGEVTVKDDRDVVQNWEKLKEIERAENGRENQQGLLDGIPGILPALSQAQSIQDRAARVGFDWPEIQPVLDKVMEEMQEVNEAANAIDRAGELGDLLFAVVNLVRWYGVDAESALRSTNTKFRKRFAYIEVEARKAGKELQQMSLAEMDALWEAAKEFDQ